MHKLLRRGDPLRCRYCDIPLIMQCINPWEFNWVWKRGGWEAQLPQNTPGKGIPPFRRATVDHLIPTSRGGQNWLENLVFACETCNDKKADMTYAEYMAKGMYNAQPS